MEINTFRFDKTVCLAHTFFPKAYFSFQAKIQKSPSAHRCHNELHFRKPLKISWQLSPRHQICNHRIFVFTELLISKPGISFGPMIPREVCFERNGLSMIIRTWSKALNHFAAKFHYCKGSIGEQTGIHLNRSNRKQRKRQHENRKTHSALNLRASDHFRKVGPSHHRSIG